MAEIFEQILDWLATLLLSFWLIPLGLLFLGFAIHRLQTLLMFFQQEEYDNSRFLNWIKAHGAYDRVFTGSAGAGLLLAFAGLWIEHSVTTYGPLLMVAFGCLAGMGRSKMAIRSNKKPLVRTARVGRINRLAIACLLGALLVVGVTAALMPISYNFAYDSDSYWGFRMTPFNMIIPVAVLGFGVLAQVLPLFLVIANKALEPFEARIQAVFLKQAKDKFARLSPTVIAITGSFGKTSTKHILQHILSAVHPTLATPGSVNTEMGITRVIREQLSEDHSYFIVEMGAYGPGSIAKLCRLTPPDVSLITAVGPAHYERFKTLETVAAAKFEMAAATAAKNSSNPVIINTEGIPAGLLEQATSDVEAAYIRAGKGGTIYAATVSQKADGLHLTVRDGASDEPLFVPLYGPHQVENIISAVTVARALGLPFSIIRAALRSVPQIRHRTEVDTSGPIATVNDAYNSNPIGFEGALKALNAVVSEGGRRIIVTPGMVELGSKHDSEHRRLGTICAANADVIIAVTPPRIPTFVEAIRDAANPDVTLIEFMTQREAEDWVRSNVRAGDAILYENNLPDLYESPPRF